MFEQVFRRNRQIILIRQGIDFAGQLVEQCAGAEIAAQLGQAGACLDEVAVGAPRRAAQDGKTDAEFGQFDDRPVTATFCVMSQRPLQLAGQVPGIAFALAQQDRVRRLPP